MTGLQTFVRLALLALLNCLEAGTSGLSGCRKSLVEEQSNAKRDGVAMSRPE